jgi:hypothetical protein
MAASPARSLAELEKRGVHFQTTEDGLTTKGSTGKLEHESLLWRGVVAPAYLDISRQQRQRYCSPQRWSRPIWRSGGLQRWPE